MTIRAGFVGLGAIGRPMARRLVQGGLPTTVFDLVPAAVDELVAAGAVRPRKQVKVLGDGELEGISLTVSAHRFSGSARDKITAAGGTVTEL